MGKARLQKALEPGSPVDLLRQEVQAIQARVAKRDAAVVDAMDRAPDETKEGFALLSELSDAALKQRGWTRRDLSIARMARRPRAKVPYFIQAANERFVARIRRTEDEAPKINLGVTINLPARAERADDSRAVIIEATEVKA